MKLHVAHFSLYLRHDVQPFVNMCCAGIKTVGKNVLVAGRSKNVGMPIAMLLHSDRNHERPGGKYILCACVCARVDTHLHIHTRQAAA